MALSRSRGRMLSEPRSSVVEEDSERCSWVVRGVVERFEEAEVREVGGWSDVVYSCGGNLWVSTCAVSPVIHGAVGEPEGKSRDGSFLGGWWRGRGSNGAGG